MARRFPHLDVSDMLSRFHSVGFCLDCTLAEDPSVVFESILSVFLKEIHHPSVLRPFPVLIGSGLRVDLLRLHLAVTRRGGCESLNKNSSWIPVTEEMDMDPSLATSMKLVCFKYLYPLEKWLRMLVIGAPSKSKTDKKGIPSTNKDKFLSPSKESVSKLNTTSCMDERDAVVVSVGMARDIASGKKGSPLDMLNLLKKLAWNTPCSDLRGLFEGRDGRKLGVGLGKLLLFRERMYPEWNDNMTYDGSPRKNGQQIYVAYQNNTKRRCSNLSKCSPVPREVECGPMESVKVMRSENQKPRCFKLLADIFSVLLNGVQKRTPVPIPIGLSFQAQVPEWTGKAPERDPNSLKWLGNRTWPLEKEAANQSRDLCIVGKGRESHCSCNLPDSVECVRLHVAEKRFNLKHELISAFSNWKFDEMGEEVSFQWTEEDEKYFKEIMIENACSSSKVTWKHLHSRFPLKEHEDLVSYYFNVFLIRRRSYQNRVTPNNISCDHDNADFDFLSTSFNHHYTVPDQKLSY